MKRLSMFLLCMCALALFSVLSANVVNAQDFYGEGNVLIAVDMGEFAENEKAKYSENSMGKLVWGENARSGISTRPEFSNQKHIVPDSIKPARAPEYKIETAYQIGQRFFIPYLRNDDPDFSNKIGWISEKKFPKELFDSGNSRFPIPERLLKVKNNITFYKQYYEKTSDGEKNPCYDYLEIECVGVSEHSTVWQYTGVAFSTRTGFDIEEYSGAVHLSDNEIKYLTGLCDAAYESESRIYGDPHFEDLYGDRDGKAAYIVVNLDKISSTTQAFYDESLTENNGFDGLIIGNHCFSKPKSTLESVIYHELNHYTVFGCLNHRDNVWNTWVGEAFAMLASLDSGTDDLISEYINPTLQNCSSRLRLIPGMLWDYESSKSYPIYNQAPYTLGAGLFQFIEKETTGKTDGLLWTEFFARQANSGSIRASDLDRFLRDTTQEGLDDWLAQFLAAVVIDAGNGNSLKTGISYFGEYGLDPNVFFRDYKDYGKKLDSLEGAADDSIKNYFTYNSYGLSAVRGGGTTYAFRNDAGGRISITGAEDTWYFFAAYINLSDSITTIEISSVEGLEKIGTDRNYPYSGNYVLTTDIDLGGKKHPWKPIGGETSPFTGTFDGSGHTISGLYINDPTSFHQGLFGTVSGNAKIKDLTVKGIIKGAYCIGGIAGWNDFGMITNCKSAVNISGETDCGGIVGYLYLGTVTGCESTGKITGNNCIGGITGYGSWATVSKCKSQATVKGTKNVGGIAGYSASCKVEKCKSSASVKGKKNFDKIVGHADADSIIRDNKRK